MRNDKLNIIPHFLKRGVFVNVNVNTNNNTKNFKPNFNIFKTVTWILGILTVLTAVYPPLYFMCSEKVRGAVIRADYTGEPNIVVIEYYFDSQRYTITEQDTGYQYDHKMTEGENMDVYCLRFLPSFADTVRFIWNVYWLTGIFGLLFALFLFLMKKSGKMSKYVTVRKIE